MTKSFGKALSEMMIKLQAGTKESIIGCSENEIYELMYDQHVNALPRIYIEFLRYAGKRAGGMWAGSDAFHPYLLGAKNDANELLEENKMTRLGDTSFVFLIHEGYQFMYFDTTVVDNPEIFYYIESNNYYVPKGKLSYFLTHFVETKTDKDNQIQFLAKYGYD